EHRHQLLRRPHVRSGALALRMSEYRRHLRRHQHRAAGVRRLQDQSHLFGEAGYHNLGKATAPGSSIEGHAWDAVGIAAWPSAGALSIYGKFGTARVKPA